MESLDPVDLLAAYLEKAAEESCGQCAPCRFGTARTAMLSARLAKGEGTQADLEQIRHLVRHISLPACPAPSTWAGTGYNALRGGG